MVLYHGTVELFAKNIIEGGVLLNRNFKSVDFGNGFYTTPDIKFALSWAKRKSVNFGDKASIVKIVVDDKSMETLTTYFNDDIEWARFVINNRNGMEYISKVDYKVHNLDARFDITCGKISDYQVVKIASDLKKSCTMINDARLILNTDYAIQYAFHTQKALGCIIKMSYQNV